MADRNLNGNGTGNAALKVQVDGLAADIARIDAKIDRLAQPSTPQYTTWLAAAGLAISVMVGFFSLGISPIKDAISKNDADTRISIEKVEREAKFARSEILVELKDMRNSVVPRGEHEQRWRSLEATDAVLGARIDATGKTLAELYSPKDAFKEMQAQINDLRAVISKIKP